MKKVNEIRISDKKVIDEIKAIQSYIKKKGVDASDTEIVYACIRLAKRLSAENWGIYLEVTHAYDKAFKEVKGGD